TENLQADCVQSRQAGFIQRFLSSRKRRSAFLQFSTIQYNRFFTILQAFFVIFSISIQNSKKAKPQP
ncbi:MAG: hypothetical protein ACLTYC_08850, partial [Ruminococcus callidus]|uniref:hypothetical protein n=1 Tax=Ruminococcus callidus TaxID=40519 RepID=UPI0039928C28